MRLGIEGLLGELVLGPSLDRAGLRALCDKHALSADDTRALLDQSERLETYRELVQGNLREAVELSIPRSIARLGGVFDEYFARFLAEQGPRTHYLRDVTQELLAFCAPRWAEDARVPDYLYDLAWHESLHIEVSALPAPTRLAEPSALALESGMNVLTMAVSGAPFIGLLGTVWGVMDAFGGIAAAGNANLAAMAPGVSGALITTVTGLLVAIPAMFGYNFLVTTIRAMTVDMDNFAAELASEFEHRYVDHTGKTTGSRH